MWGAPDVATAPTAPWVNRQDVDVEQRGQDGPLTQQAYCRRGVPPWCAPTQSHLLQRPAHLSASSTWDASRATVTSCCPWTQDRASRFMATPSMMPPAQHQANVARTASVSRFCRKEAESSSTRKKRDPIAWRHDRSASSRVSLSQHKTHRTQPARGGWPARQCLIGGPSPGRPHSFIAAGVPVLRHGSGAGRQVIHVAALRRLGVVGQASTCPQAPCCMARVMK
jgi:hypothetical protein